MNKQGKVHVYGAELWCSVTKELKLPFNFRNKYINPATVPYYTPSSLYRFRANLSKKQLQISTAYR
jgi:hypothetical protein